MSITFNNLQFKIGMTVQAVNDSTNAKFSLDGTGSTEKFQTSSSYDPEKLLDASGQVLSDTSNLDIDLYDLGTWDIGSGAGRDTLAQAHTNSLIYMLYVKNDSDSTGNLVFDTSQTGGWTSWMPSGTHTLEPGASLCGVWPSGIAVADTSNHILRLTAASGDVTFDLQMLST